MSYGGEMTDTDTSLTETLSGGTYYTGKYPQCTSAVPPASVLASEFYNLQDMDGNDLIYGYDFKIKDSDEIPPDKPILLVMLENNPYWKNPEEEKTWKEYLDEIYNTTETSTDSPISGTYSLSLLKEINSMLWLIEATGSKVYIGEYHNTVVNGKNTGEQYYHVSSPPFTSWERKGLPGSEGHESSRVHNLNGEIFITTEGGNVYNSSGQKLYSYGNYYLLTAVYFNGMTLFCVSERRSSGLLTTGTQVYSASSKWRKFSKIMAFTACVYDGYLYLGGVHAESSSSGYSTTGLILKINSDGNVVSEFSPDPDSGVNWLTVFNNKLYALFGKTDPSVYSTTDGKSWNNTGKTFSGMEAGNMVVFNGQLFVALEDSTGAELWSMSTDEKWTLRFGKSDFSSLGTNPAAKSGLIDAAGFMCTTKDSDGKDILIVTYPGGSYRSGPSWVYKVSVSESSSTDTDIPFDLKDVVWLDNDVSEWEITATLESVSISGDIISLPYNKANVWEGKTWDNSNDGLVNANAWIFVKKNNTWYAATWEWMAVGQTNKDVSAVSGDNIKEAELNGFKPVSGTSYGFMISGLARDDIGISNVKERSNIVMFTWP